MSWPPSDGLPLGRIRGLRKYYRRLGKKHAAILNALHRQFMGFAWRIECFGKGTSQMISLLLRLALDNIVVYVVLLL